MLRKWANIGPILLFGWYYRTSLASKSCQNSCELFEWKTLKFKHKLLSLHSHTRMFCAGWLKYFSDLAAIYLAFPLEKPVKPGERACYSHGVTCSCNFPRCDFFFYYYTYLTNFLKKIQFDFQIFHWNICVYLLFSDPWRERDPGFWPQNYVQSFLWRQWERMRTAHTLENCLLMWPLLTYLRHTSAKKLC